MSVSACPRQQAPEAANSRKKQAAAEATNNNAIHEETRSMCTNDQLAVWLYLVFIHGFIYLVNRTDRRMDASHLSLPLS